MKKIILLWALVLSGFLHAQTVAIQPPSLSQCNNEVFNLNVQTPIILGAQDPQYFYVTYYTSGSDAETENNAIQQPSFFVSQQSQVIFARVDSLTDETYAITQFEVTWGSANAQQFPDVVACESWVPPLPTVGSIWTGPNGTGTQILPGTVITTPGTQVFYVYNQDGPCTAESSFTVTIVSPIAFTPMPDIVSCGPYTLPALPNGLNYTFNGQDIPAGTAIYETSLLGIRAPYPCGELQQFTVLIGGGVNTVTAPPLVACSTDGSGFAFFDLVSASSWFMMGSEDATVTFYLSEQDAMNGQNPIANPESFLGYPGIQMVYVRTTFASSDCVAINTLFLVIQPCFNNMVTVSLHVDYDGTGCTPSSPPLCNAMVSLISGNSIFYGSAGPNGSISFANIPAGPAVVMPVNIPDGLAISGPSSQTIFMEPNVTNNYQVDFCYSPVAAITDVQVSVYPIGNARPGFPAYYAIIVSNLGTSTASGTVTLQFDGTRLSLIGSEPAAFNQTNNTISLSYSDLAPWQSTYLWINFVVAMPPIADLGDQLSFTVSCTSNQPDNNPDNNIMSFFQPVVNSFDPNDIAVLEGPVIPQEQADDWLHYIVRFENTGTAEAVNVRVENTLSDLLNWNTLAIEGSSHPVVTNWQGNLATFRFDNINLPATSQDAVSSHGWVAYRVKPGANFVQGTTIENNAHIYFDFNAGVMTNTVTTELAPLSIADPKAGKFVLYPNPAGEFIRVTSTNTPSEITVYDITGRRMPVSTRQEGTETLVNTAPLPSGVYTVKIRTESGITNRKLLKK